MHGARQMQEMTDNNKYTITGFLNLIFRTGF